MLLFIDTEFADTTASELVSIALVSEDGQFEFYAERDPLPSSPTDFVRSLVYPLLNRGERALKDVEFTRQLHAFFDRVKSASRHGKVLVAYDFPADIHLLDYALDDFQSPATPTRPVFNEFNLDLLGGEYGIAVEVIFESNADLRARRHHALIDAWVNRDAYLVVRKLHSERSAAEIAAKLTIDGADSQLTATTPCSNVRKRKAKALRAWNYSMNGQSGRRTGSDRIRINTRCRSAR